MSQSSLYALFEGVPDPRSTSGRRYPLAAVAMLSGARSLEAIAQFGRDRGRRFAAALGFTRSRTPCAATFHHVLKRLDADRFESAICQWMTARRASGWRAVSIDGKRLSAPKAISCQACTCWRRMSTSRRL